IIDSLTATATAAERESSAPSAPSAGTPVPPLLAMLPDAPLPFPADAAPRDIDGLKNFITGMQRDGEGEPSHAEQWQFNLALAALHVDPEKIPEAIRLEAH